MNEAIAQQPKTIDEVVATGLCIGCGVCAYSESIRMEYSRQRAQFVPLSSAASAENALAYELCPGKGYSIVEEARQRYQPARYDPSLGFVLEYCAAVSTDPEILSGASSGGAMTTIAVYLLQKKIVDSVVVTRFSYADGPRTVCTLARSRTDLLDAQGSKYCPVDLSDAIRAIKQTTDRVAVLGTPCQIAGIRNIQRLDPSFREKVVLTVATFCGGIKSYDNIDLLATRHGIDPREISDFRFRGDGQPGRMLIEDRSGNRAEIPYPAYNGHTGLSKHLRCHLCVDATGELGDLACGDAWLPRFQRQTIPWSIIMARSEMAASLLRRMIAEGHFQTESVTLTEIKRSQIENLTSKKVRQKARRRLYRLLGRALPSFDGGYQTESTSLSTEVKVLAKHSLKGLLEKCHIFYPVYKVFKRYRRAGTAKYKTA